jgi:hypothetical protein
MICNLSGIIRHAKPAGDPGNDLLVQKAHSPQAIPGTTGLYRAKRGTSSRDGVW